LGGAPFGKILMVVVIYVIQTFAKSLRSKSLRNEFLPTFTHLAIACTQGGSTLVLRWFSFSK